MTPALRASSSEEAADGDVGFDVQHDDVLALLHRLERDERSDAGIAGRVDDDVDAADPHMAS